MKDKWNKPKFRNGIPEFDENEEEEAKRKIPIWKKIWNWIKRFLSLINPF